MTYEEAVIEFLSQKDNFRLALEVADRLEEAKRRVEIDFWHNCHQKLSQRLDNSPHRGTWATEIDSDEKLTREEAGIRLAPVVDDANALRLIYYLTHGRWAGSFWFYYGISMLPEKDLTPHGATGIDKLRKRLAKDGYSSSKYSVGWKQITKYDGPNKFLIELVERPDEFAAQTIDLIWAAFENTVAEAEKINVALRSRT